MYDYLVKVLIPYIQEKRKNLLIIQLLCCLTISMGNVLKDY